MSIDRVKEMYNAAVHPDVMCDRITKEEALQEYLDKSFAELDSVSQADFLEYYLLHYGDMVCETAFELRMMKDYKASHHLLPMTHDSHNVKGECKTNELAHFIELDGVGVADPFRHLLPLL